MLDYLDQGGVFIYPIILGSIWAFTLIFERLYFFKKKVSKYEKEFEGYLKDLKTNGNEALLAKLESKKGFVAQLLKAAWKDPHADMTKVERRVEEVIHKHMPEFDKHISTISMLAGVQPLLGLLGTITGMIAVFAVISTQGTGDPKALADGISEAMITTQAGLCAAVPILIGHNFLRNRFKNVLYAIQAICAKALDQRA
jgi:biopolymer transport protein ExbB